MSCANWRCCCVVGPVYDGGLSLYPPAVYLQLQLPERLRVLDRFLRALLPHHVCRLLPTSLPEHEEDKTAAAAADTDEAGDQRCYHKRLQEDRLMRRWAMKLLFLMRCVCRVAGRRWRLDSMRSHLYLAVISSSRAWQ